MTGYLIRRIGTSIIVMLGISILIFAMLHMISSTPGRAVLGLRASPQAVAAFDKAHGYDKPLIVQYFAYLNQLLHGNLGYSYKLNQSVDSLLAENAPRSALLSGTSLVLAILIAVPLGVYQAVKRNSVGDYVATSASFTFYSMPTFLLGLLLIAAFSLYLPLFPAEASQSRSVFGVMADPRSMVLPVATLTLVSVAGLSRYMRSSALDSLAQDYIRTARAKGLRERVVLFRHMLRNAILPIVTILGLSVPVLLAGNLVTETVFNYPGLGLMFFTALGNEDYPVLLAYTLIAGALTVIGNFLADVSLAVVDPRIRYS